jgi:O-methyltransferase domain
VSEPRHPQQHVAPLLQAAFGAQTAQILYVAAKLGLADQLGSGARSASDLAASPGLNAAALQRVLRGLVGLGVCAELDGLRFELTPLGQHLRADHPDSVCARVILNVEVHHALWSDLLATMKTGEAASRRVFGMPFYDHLAQDKTRGAVFDRAMTSGGWVSSRIRPAVEAYDFGQFRTIVDVGGGNGTLLVELLKACPQLTGTVFDLPRLAEAAQQTIATAGLTARGRFIGGNAFEAVPAGADAYVLSNFLNSWGDEQALLVLRHCRKAMAPAGKLILIEWVMASADEPKHGFRFWDTVTMDLVMLAAFGSESGRIRTRREFQTLLETAGFTLAAVLPTSGSVSVIEAQPD